jgi:hypothetical protein
MFRLTGRRHIHKHPVVDEIAPTFPITNYISRFFLRPSLKLMVQRRLPIQDHSCPNRESADVAGLQS